MISTSPAMTTAIEALVHKPAFTVLSYDISCATGESWGSIIAGTAVQTPVDLTPWVSSVQWNYGQVTVTLSDDTFLFHPDTGSLRDSIKQGRGIRVIEGFRDVPEDQWEPIFSGIIQGSYGWNFLRGQPSVVQFSVFSRESNQAWKKRMVTSKEYTIGTDWYTMFENIAVDVMAMTTDELAAGGPWNLMFDKTSNQIVNIPPWEGLTQLAQGNMSRIWFNGKGQLATYKFSLKHQDLVMTDSKRLSSYVQPSGTNEAVNKVVVTYLDNELTKVSGPQQSLGTANITTGFFDLETKLDVFYSDDKKQRAENVKLVVKQSINQNDLGISIGSERLEIDDEFGGQLIVRVDAFVSALAVAGIGGIIASSFIGDTVVGVGAGTTIPTGRIIEGAAIVAVLVAMMILGTGVYEIVGNPYDMAYLEKQAIALLNGIKFWEEVQLDIRNDFISTEEFAHQLAVTELIYHQSARRPRTIAITNDLRIERGDIIKLPSGVKFYVLEASKTLSRGSSSSMSLTGFRVIA